MKYILSFLVLINLSLSSYTQVLVFVAGDTLIKNIDVDDYSPAWTEITNLMDTTVIFKWEIITYDHPLGWEFSICDYPFCYTDGQMNGTMDPVPPLSDYAFLTVNVESTYPDTAVYKVAVWNENYPLLRETLTVIMVSTSNFSQLKEDFKIESPSFYYHHANRQLCGKNPTSSALKLTIYGIGGQLIRTYTIPPDEAYKINVSDLTEGHYIAYLGGMNTPFTIERFSTY